MGYGAPLSGFSANASADTPLPPYNSVAIDSFPKVAPTTAVAMKSDSGITYNLPLPRKRARDHSTISHFLSYPSSAHAQKNCGCFYFLGEDISIHIQQQQFDLDRLISQHMEKVRMEVEEKRKREARRILEVIEVGIMKILRNKEEEIEKIGKLNWELEERVNSLCMENQIWRDVAQTNEATANALRTNLEQVLSQVKNDPAPYGAGLDDPTTTALVDDAESCCGSNGDGDQGGEDKRVPNAWRNIEAESKRGRKMTQENDNLHRNNGDGIAGTRSGGGGGDRRCKNCWKEDSCVLLLPCRHLCLCTVCGSSLYTCPICNSTNNASVRVIMP